VHVSVVGLLLVSVS